MPLPAPRRRHARTVITLGLAQTLAWASSYYLLAIVGPAIAQELHLPLSTVFAAFSAALLVAAAVGPFAGRAIDARGGRPVLIGSNVVFAVGLAALGSCAGPWGLFAAWILLGVGMGSGLYEAAFSSLVRLYGKDARNAITGITLLAGFASTIGWPLTTWLSSHLGWRGACFAWAALHVAIGCPLNAMLPRADARRDRHSAQPASDGAPALPPARRRGIAIVLAAVFGTTWFISTAMAAHLPHLLQLCGLTLAAAVGVGALVGPAQVGGRLLELGVLRRIHPLLSARLATLLHPAGAVLLLAIGAPVAAGFAVLHGVGNGILTIANGTLPLLFFGPAGYGKRQGLLMVPSRIAQALSPWLFGLAIERWDARALAFSAALGCLAFGALLVLRAPRTPEASSIDAAVALRR